MLRSIFSLIQRIIDSDKKYNNTKSKAVIYCFTNPDNTVNMNLEVDGKNRPLKALQPSDKKTIKSQREQTFSIETQHGDVVTCKHHKEIRIIPRSSKDGDENRITFTNGDNEQTNGDDRSAIDADAELRPNVRDVLAQLPKEKVEIYSKTTDDQISVLLEQIQKMKTGLERLHEIALQFNCSEKFSDDLNYLINNMRPHLEKQSKKRDKCNISPKPT